MDTKLLFWTDSGNILGLLPPGAPGAAKGNGTHAYRLLAFPADDYPNKWGGEVEIEDGVWYDAHVTIRGKTVEVSVSGPMSGPDWSRTWRQEMDVDFAGDHNGP